MHINTKKHIWVPDLEGEEKKENSWEERGTLEGKDGFSGFLKLRLLLRQDEVLEVFMEVEVEVTEIPNGMLRISWTTISLSLSFPTESEVPLVFAPRQLGLTGSELAYLSHLCC